MTGGPLRGPVERLRLTLSGVVQGVGFRPFVHRLARTEGLGGFVRNTGAGVVVEVEGPRPALQRFRARLAAEMPRQARIGRSTAERVTLRHDTDFRIDPSAVSPSVGAAVTPDLVTCRDCLAEILNPADRRYRYPFTTCVNCGPRYSIIESPPYDRERTTMRPFPMCVACHAEYTDPDDRRFHAEPIACPGCGPRLELWDRDGRLAAAGDDVIGAAAAALRRGEIVAVKGLGGFQLLVDACDDAAVRRLRTRKRRMAKPLAIMVATVGMAQQLAMIDAPDLDLLCSAAGPIVLLQARRDADRLSPAVAPGMPALGVMLPTTPLHHLLLADFAGPVIATSGNLSGEPIVVDEADAAQRLADIADCFLVHDRPIRNRVDDSVVRIIAGQPTVLRCARGYAPATLAWRGELPATIAVGGQQKSALAVCAGGTAVLGPHIGDLDDADTRRAFHDSLVSLPSLHGIRPDAVAHDRHPGYVSSEEAAELPLPAIAVPHHLAHVLSCMVDNGLSGPVLGVAWDGTGLGDDDTVWGGEFLAVDDYGYRRCATLWPFRLPGGDAAAREPRRSALGVLDAMGPEWQQDATDLAPVRAYDTRQRQTLKRMMQHELNAPKTTSAGRLFDAIAALLGLCQINDFEGQAAMMLEAAAAVGTGDKALPAAGIVMLEGRMVIDWRPTVGGMVSQVRAGASAADLGHAFHHALADAISEVAYRMAIPRVVLTGGCFQNDLLACLAVERLQQRGLSVMQHRWVPPNDGGLAVGQLAFAARPRLRETD